MTTTPPTPVDERTALSELAVATLRTAVPALWGTLVAALLAVLAGHLPDDVTDALAGVLASDVVLGLVVTLVIALWYWLWRRVEQHLPLWLVRLVLGSARTPVYALTPADAVLTEVAQVEPVATRSPCDQCGAPSTYTTTQGGIRFCDEHGPRSR
ncbi:hypothetical protein [Cellulomonas uda]|uniref:Uncharacterized protein n=1 Tax=Cellulomonas uda TaxID=1714 RepID=A0A4Y3KAA9_CELUD|nr:hypothetical protein [Cellulomonas uda]NII67828.1 hypothetical protein [Cellulomonas uda]GEA79925.1 hypothetical protein CUD01_03690 [Cellulomonas uda]